MLDVAAGSRRTSAQADRRVDGPANGSLMPEAANGFEVFPGMVKKWGLAGLIITQPATSRARRWAWARVHNTYFWVDPTRRVAGVLLIQLEPLHSHLTNGSRGFGRVRVSRFLIVFVAPGIAAAQSHTEQAQLVQTSNHQEIRQPRMSRC